jgi:pimeloyl-ACP methyl ester carboxylesterase
MDALFVFLFLSACFSLYCEAYTPTTVPKISPATNLPNQLYQWRQTQQIRYQQAGPSSGDPVLLVHGLFVNSDHWRKTLLGLADEGYNVYAVDLWGYGYSSKPPYNSPDAQAMNGESRRPLKMIEQFELGTANGQGVRVRDIDLKHPVGSPYNFYTWSDLIVDFSRDVIISDDKNKRKLVTLVSNSIGTSSALQAVIDEPDLFSGVCVVTPNFRELHSAEVPCSEVVMPVIKQIQKMLRENGQPLFDALAKPETVRQILREPYRVRDAIDDTLVAVLLDPLLLEGASKVVFDTLSYSAGPLPEQQLSMFPPGKPVWITYGEEDPWTPNKRVDALINKPCVEKVVPLPGIGHCPHGKFR